MRYMYVYVYTYISVIECRSGVRKALNSIPSTVLRKLITDVCVCYFSAKHCDQVREAGFSLLVLLEYCGKADTIAKLLSPWSLQRNSVLHWLGLSSLSSSSGPAAEDHAVEWFPLHGNTPSWREQQAQETGLYKQTIKASWSQCLYIYLKTSWRWRKWAFRYFLRQENTRSNTCSLRMQKRTRSRSGLDNCWGGKALLPTGVSANHAGSSRVGFSVMLVPLSPPCSSSTLWLHSSNICLRSHRLIKLELNGIVSLISYWYLWWIGRPVPVFPRKATQLLYCWVSGFQMNPYRRRKS